MRKLTAPICKAARAMLGMTQADLARAAGIGLATLRRFEVENILSLETEAKIIPVLEKRLVFINSDNEIVGVVYR